MNFAFIALIVALTWLGGVRLLNFTADKWPHPFSRFIQWTHAITFELLAFLGVMLLRFLPSSAKIAGSGRPILLVHGYVNHGSVWRFLKRRLKTAGLGPIYTINLGHPFRSIRTYAEKVALKAKVIAQETGRSDLILIGHSMGGLVSAWYATQLAPPNTITDLITIASPLAGTPVARMGLGPNAREMQPHSPLLEQLHSALQNQPFRLYHIATHSDLLVVPGISAIFPHNSHFLLDDIGHASLLYSTRVAAQICQWIREEGI